MCVGLHVKCLLFPYDFHRYRNVPKKVSKNSEYEIRLVELFLFFHADGTDERKDGQYEANSCYSLCDASQKESESRKEESNQGKNEIQMHKVRPEIILIKSTYFSSICYHTSTRGPKVSRVNVALSPKFAYPPS